MRLTPGKLLLFAAVLVTTAGCDHVTKSAAISLLEGSAPLTKAGGAVRFQLAANEGAFLSLGSRLPETLRDSLFLVVVPVVLLWLCARFLVARRVSWPLTLGLGLVAGGGFANWADRLASGGAVTDFIVLRLGPLHTGFFNVADVAILAGAILIAFSAVRPSARA